MFFAKGEFEKLPEELQKELEPFYIKYEQFHDLYDNGEDITNGIIDCIILSLKIYLKWAKNSEKSVKDLMSSAIGNIPLTLDLDKIKINKKVKESIHPLIDIIDAPPANLHINRKLLIMKVLKDLKEIKQECPRPRLC